MQEWIEQVSQYVRTPEGLAVMGVGALVALLLIYLLGRSIARRLLVRLSRVSRLLRPRLVLKLLLAPIITLIILLTLKIFVESFSKMFPLLEFLDHVMSIAIIVGLTWLALRAIGLVRESLLIRFDLDRPDNLRARKVSTQIRVFEKILIALVILIAIAAALMTFEQVRQIGTSILASAGIAGIIVGFAAQKSLATLLAGIQIALTQPIRLDDVLIVEGEWGRVEEITLTYVVVRIWDKRRLILPITYFIEKPFQNWTRVSADLLGTVYLYTDWRVTLDELREELKRVVKDHPLWDGLVAIIQVTDVKERNLEVRALVSAGDASALWELRCHVREQLILYLRRNHPQSLPLTRVQLERDKNQ